MNDNIYNPYSEGLPGVLKNKNNVKDSSLYNKGYIYNRTFTRLAGTLQTTKGL